MQQGVQLTGRLLRELEQLRDSGSSSSSLGEFWVLRSLGTGGFKGQGQTILSVLPAMTVIMKLMVTTTILNEARGDGDHHNNGCDRDEGVFAKK